MIVRTWHGRTSRADADAYADYVLLTGIPEQLATPGNLGSLLCRRFEGDEAHFSVMSFWDSNESIRAFAGSDPDTAVYYPEDEQFLLELEPTVAHSEVVKCVVRNADGNTIAIGG